MFLPSPKILVAGLSVLSIGTQQVVATKAEPEPGPAPVAAAPSVVLPSDKGMSQDYGVKNRELYGDGAHDGIDMKNQCGDPVKSPTNGRVTDIGEDEVYGTFVWVTGYDGWKHLFGHTTVGLKVGDNVIKGTVLGTTNKTGHTTGCHLHWTATRAGKIEDPKTWLREPEVCPKLTNVPIQYGVPICAASTKYSVDPALVAAIIFYENRAWPPTDKNVCSHAGACGIAQFIEPTWKAYGVDGDGDGKADRSNWLDSIHSSAHYLGRMKKSVRDSAIEYNCGPSCRWNSETADYVVNVERLHNEFTIK